MVTENSQRERAELKKLIIKDAYIKEKVTLSSGLVSDFYIDARRVTLNAQGAYLCARLILDIIEDEKIDAIGGPTLGADPIIGAISVLSLKMNTVTTNSKYPNLIQSEMELMIYPNPSLDNFVIQYNLSSSTDVRIELLDLNGRVLQTFVNKRMDKDENVIQVESNMLESGIYFCKMLTGNAVVTKKIIVF